MNPTLAKFLALTSLALGSLTSTAVAQAGTGGFKAGDLYLHQVVYTGNPQANGGIVRIDPLSGATELLHNPVTMSNATQGIAYDPWRDRLLFFAGFVPNSLELWASDAVGNLHSLGMQTAAGGARGLLAPRGDGIVYLLNPLNEGTISYLDAADQLHVLKVPGGATWQFSVFEVQIQSMVYAPKTNSLIITLWAVNEPCPGSPFDSTSIHRLDLSADGSEVIAETCFWYDSKPGDIDGQTRGLSIGPDGNPILVIGNGGSGSGPQGRIATIDLDTNTASTFATTEFFAQHRIVGGVYSRSRGQVVVHDSFEDKLRAYSQGQSGGGTLYSSGLSSSSSSGEQAAMTEVSTGAYLTGLSSGTSTVSLAAGGTQALEIDLGASYAGATYFAVGSASGWAPGIPVDGQLLPLNFDAYFDQLLGSPNQVPLLNSLGALGGQGEATVTFQVPAGTSPSLAGLVLHHAAMVFGPTLTVQRTTNPVSVELVP